MQNSTQAQIPKYQTIPLFAVRLAIRQRHRGRYFATKGGVAPFCEFVKPKI